MPTPFSALCRHVPPERRRQALLTTGFLCSEKAVCKIEKPEPPPRERRPGSQEGVKRLRRPHTHVETLIWGIAVWDISGGVCPGVKALVSIRLTCGRLVASFLLN